MPSFAEMGLREEILRTLEEEEIATPTALQEAVIPALRRGGNLVARASSGSGKTLAYALGVLDRLKVEEPSEESGPRALIIAPAAAEAERIALAIIPYAHAQRRTIAAAGSPWGVPVGEADLIVSAVSEVMAAVRSSSLKLDDLEAVVIDNAASVAELGDWDEVDSLLDLIPRDAQRIVFSAVFTRPIEELLERRVKRALHYPVEPAVADRSETAAANSINFFVASESAKVRLLAEQLAHKEAGSAPPVIFCRSDEGAANLAEALAIRGFVVGDPADAEADVAIVASEVSRGDLLSDDEGVELGQTISYDVPGDAATLRARHAGDSDAIILVEPRELAHLKEIARQAKLAAEPIPVPVGSRASGADLLTYRDDLRRAIGEEDLGAQMLILEPLFDEFTAAEVAAAASALLRERRQRTTPPAAPATAKKVETTAPPGPAPVTWARLFVSIGSRDEIRHGDLLGAMAGEANIPGSKIGKIEIRDSFSIVEVQAEVADQVIRAVNGTTMKGRSLRVDYDRGGPTRRPPPRPGGQRRTTRRPPGA